MKTPRTLRRLAAPAAATLALSLPSLLAQPGWVAGDFHQHTTYTDGSNPIATVMYYNDYYGLDWWANSEHGGVRARDGFGPVIPPGDPQMDTSFYARYWDDTSVYPAGTILGDVNMSGTHQQMWRWQSLRDYSFPDVLTARATYPDRLIIQGVEWNPPGHEHCSVGILNGQFDTAPQADLLAAFDYLFDKSDTDSTGGKAQGYEALADGGVKNQVNSPAGAGHLKSVQAAEFLNQYAPYTSWMIPTHVERAKGYKIEHFRDLNNAAPTACFGFDSMPGHQKEADRGSYGAGADGGGTYGGCGIYAARVGGLWDALLGEGRGWWFFASSDFHSTGADFWPGEYQKTYTYVEDQGDPQALVDGLRSGKTFVVEGDLINEFEFGVGSGSKTATMGESLELGLGNTGAGGIFRMANVTVYLEFKSPAANNHGDTVRLDHVDIIAGQITGIVAPGSPNYTVASNPSAKVIARYFNPDSANSPKWSVDPGTGRGFITLNTRLRKDTYFRVRGTNNPLNSPEIDPDSPNGDPAKDVPGQNTAAKAWADLWFYSNPVFVYLDTKP